MLAKIYFHTKKKEKKLYLINLFITRFPLVPFNSILTVTQPILSIVNLLLSSRDFQSVRFVCLSPRVLRSDYLVLNYYSDFVSRFFFFVLRVQTVLSPIFVFKNTRVIPLSRALLFSWDISSPLI